MSFWLGLTYSLNTLQKWLNLKKKSFPWKKGLPARPWIQAGQRIGDGLRRLAPLTTPNLLNDHDKAAGLVWVAMQYPSRLPPHYSCSRAFTSRDHQQCSTKYPPSVSPLLLLRISLWNKMEMRVSMERLNSHVYSLQAQLRTALFISNKYCKQCTRIFFYIS